MKRRLLSLFLTAALLLGMFPTAVLAGGTGETGEDLGTVRVIVENTTFDAEKAAELKLPFMPYFPSGWDPRPWYDPRPSFSVPNGEEIYKGVKALCALMEDHPTLGISCGKLRRSAFSVYAWNEYGEGGYLAPTLIEYDNKLQGLYHALCEMQAHD